MQNLKRWSVFDPGSAEEEQSLELLVVLYDKLGMNDKAVAAITASLSLVSARHHSDRDRAGLACYY